MGRPAKFSRDIALTAAQRVFLSRGFEATSLDDLLTAMNIGRQSLYNSFGDKRSLFLEAVKIDVEQDIKELQSYFPSKQPLRDSVQNWLNYLANMLESDKRQGCLILNSAMELAGRDQEVANIVNHSRQSQEDIFYTAFEKAKENKELAKDFDSLNTARFFVISLAGMIIIAKSNPKSPCLNVMAQKLIESIT